MTELSLQTDLVRHHGKSVAVISLDGYVDGHTSPQLGRAVGRMVAEGATDIVLDARHLHYINAAGLRLVARALRDLEARQGRLLLACLPESLKRLFDGLGLADVVPIVPTRRDALDAID